MSNKKIALIPAYEPDMILIRLLEQLAEAGMEAVVVDDGSGSEYSDVFDKASSLAVILRHHENRGKGRALKTGLAYIRENYESDAVIVTVDADGQHRVEDAGMLCEVVIKQPEALVLGSRKFKKDVPLRSRFGNAITRFVCRHFTGLKVYDTQTGLRAFHMDRISHLLGISGERYEYEMNMLLEFTRKQIPIREVEIETIYIDNNSSSHFDTVWDSYRVYKELLKFSASSLIGFLIDYTLYGLLLLLTGNIRTANIGARIVSATANYAINRRYVFESSSGIIKSAVSYFILAAVILAGNTVVLSFLVNTAGLHRMLAKILTEIIFFMLSWTVQRFVIFGKKEIKGIK